MDELNDEVARRAQILPIHFDVPGHRIPLATFVRTAVQATAILRAFNQELFDGLIDFDVVVLPPEEGTFLTRLGIAVAIAAVPWGFLESDIGKAFVEGLTTHEPAYWAHLVGEEVRKHYVEGEDQPSPISDEEFDEFQCRFSATVLTEATKAFLQSAPGELEKVGMTPRRYPAAFLARNEFYEACADTPGLRAIGFTEAPHFPVPRSSFAEFRVPVPQRDDEEETPWLTGTQLLKVTSPNWDRNDKQRQWKGRDARGRERFFRIEDEHFWMLVRADQLNPHIVDTIKVQWAFHGTTDNPRSCRVLKVLEYNGATLSTPFDDSALASILGPYREIDEGQGDLFGDEPA